ncbi:MAG TPA: LPS export ABC transporter periplasmic protein LptC [Myxococcota bacterium]|nr:LPS export ABC transporter periplasmic protein LptC [Myxococcota bacterium]
MRPPARRISLAFAAASVAVALSYAARAEAPPAAKLTLSGMSYVLSRSGEVALLVEAKRAEVSPHAGRIELAGVRARVGAAAGARGDLGGFELTCARGTLDLDAREFVALGGIDGRMRDGRTLRTERLRYRHERGAISGDAPVALRDHTGEYHGGGFEYWVRSDRFRLTGGARISQGSP